MYVILPLSWFKYSFLKNRFLFTVQEQINKIYKSGLKAMNSFEALIIMKVEMLGVFQG
jgi:hypothetical protein